MGSRAEHTVEGDIINLDVSLCKLASTPGFRAELTVQTTVAYMPILMPPTP